MLELLIDIRQTLGGISRRLERIERKEDVMAMDLSQLEAAVKANSDAEDSAIALIKGLADQVAAVAPNKQAIDALASKIKSQADALAAAVVANTPAAENPPTPASPPQTP